MSQKTLSIVKPDGTEANVIGEVLRHFEKENLKVCALRMLKLSKEQAGGFYAVHKERPFYDELTTFMSSGPIVVMVLEGDNAIARTREIMGATNPEEAAAGTIRAQFASSIQNNIVHGSDSPESAATEIEYFSKDLGLTASA